jgi:arylsulfatase A-like enzyme
LHLLGQPNTVLAIREAQNAVRHFILNWKEPTNDAASNVVDAITVDVEAPHKTDDDDKESGKERAAAARKRPNILFLAADDLRPQLGTYAPEGWAGQHVPMVTPHIDAFANKSMVFLKSYCQQAICMATRASLLTGRRPDTTGVTAALGTYWRTNGGNFTSLPQHFREHGYTTVGHGKIFHPGSCSGGDNAEGAINPGPVIDPEDRALGDDRPYSWTNDDPDLFPGSGYYHAPNHLFWVCSAQPGYNTSCPAGEKTWTLSRFWALPGISLVFS